MRKFISTLLIIIGLAIILYPAGRLLYSNYQQNKLLAEWENASLILAEEISEVEEVEMDNEAEELERLRKREAEEKERQEYIAQNIEGLLIIDKINMKLPILKGTSPRNLLISAGSLENTVKAGEIGNYAIAGHRNYGYGRHFNRVDELDIGDVMSVEAQGSRYIYEVREKLIVEPDDAWVLKANGQDAEITLITCHPVNKPTKRLIIKGKLSQSQTK